MIHWFFVILKCQVLYYELLLRKFCDKNFRDSSEIHENHENIRPRKFGAIRYWCKHLLLLKETRC